MSSTISDLRRAQAAVANAARWHPEDTAAARARFQALRAIAALEEITVPLAPEGVLALREAVAALPVETEHAPPPSLDTATLGGAA